MEEEIKNMREFKRKLELLSILRGMQLRNEMTDVLLVSAECEIYVHSLVLAMNPFWKGLLSEEAGAADRMIFFPDYSEIELQQFVNEIYGNVTELEISGIPISKFLDVEAETKVRLQSLESLGLINVQNTSLDATEEESDFDFNDTIIQIQTEVGENGVAINVPVLFEPVQNALPIESKEALEVKKLKQELEAAKVKIEHLSKAPPPVLVELPSSTSYSASSRKSQRSPKKKKKALLLAKQLKARKAERKAFKKDKKKVVKVEEGGAAAFKLEAPAPVGGQEENQNVIVEAPAPPPADVDSDVFHDDFDSGSDTEFRPDQLDEDEEDAALANGKPEKKKVKCDICDKMFDTNFGLKKHQGRVHNEEGHKCSRCGQLFKSEGKLTKHIETAHETQNKTCDVCDPSDFFTINGLRKHLKAAHPDRCYCYKCHKTFEDKGHLLHHRKTCNNGDFVNCTLCGLIVRRAALATHVEEQHENLELAPDGKFKCDICFKEFNYFRRLAEHKKRVHDDNREKSTCDKCGKTFTTVASLRAHEDIHTDMVYCCAACGKLYSCKRSLTTHMKEKHGNRKFICPHCGRTFTHATSHARHIMTHTGEKPWKCDKCPMSFIRETRLRDHRLTHFDEKNFECEVCHMKFKNNAQRIKHAMTHKEKRYICNQCNYRCVQSMDLTKHYRKVHKMERPKFTYLNYKPDEIVIKTE